MPGAGVALACAVAALAGGAVGKERLRVVDSGRLAAVAGTSIAEPVVLLEPLRRRGAGPSVARVRLAGGPLRGEVAVLRVRGDALAGGTPGTGEILEVEGSVAPLGFFDAYQRPRGAGAAIDARAVRRTGRRRGGLAGALDAVRRRAERGLERGLREEDAALLRGMVLGQDERLPDAVRDEFQVSGLAHLLAVSGQNVMLLAILVLAAAGVVGVPLRLRLVLALLLVAAYVPLAGGGPSIQRAGVMGAAGLVAALAGRPASRWYALGLAAAGTLALNPLAPSEPGWQLSFAAVVALMAMAPALRELLARRMPGPVADAAAITIAATAGTAPLMALHFESFSLVSLPANLVAAPAVAPIMWLGMLSAAAAQVSPALAAPLNALDGPLLAYLTAVARTAAGLPHAAVPLRLASPAALAVAFALPVLIAAAARAAVRRLPPPGLGLGAGGASGSAPPGRGGRCASPRGSAAWPSPACSGSSTRTRRSAPARGRWWSRSSTSARATRRSSRTATARACCSTAARRRPRCTARCAPPECGGWTSSWRPTSRETTRAGCTRCSRGSRRACCSRTATRRRTPTSAACWPRPTRAGSGASAPGRARSCAPAGSPSACSPRRLGRRARRRPRIPTRAAWPPSSARAASTSGCPRTPRARRSCRLPLRPVEAMKVSHHGSADPGLPDVLRRLDPQVAAIEVGAGNDYGHPARSTLDALRAVPRVYRTDRDGTVVLRVADGRMTVETGA